MSDVVALPVPRRPVLTRRQRDFLLIAVSIQTQHGQFQRARTLVEALLSLGDRSAEVVSASAVLHFLDGRFEEALACLEELDRIDPLERFGSYRLNERQRMRRYLKTRCLFELDAGPRVRDALDAYLRHGEAGDGDDS